MVARSGAGTVEGMEPLDLTSAESYLRRRFEADDVKVLGGGTWSQAFAITVKGQRLVVRFGGDRAEYAKDQLAGTWSNRALPVPEVLEIGEALDRCYAVSRHVDGRPLDELDAAGWQRTLPALFDALTALRGVRLPGTGYGPFDDHGDAPAPTWSGWLQDVLQGAGEGRLSGWRDALGAVPGAMVRYEAGVERFKAVMAVCPEVRLVAHTDLGAGNTLTAGGRITGIIDWGNAVAGDPLYDVAHLTFWAPWHHGCPEDLLRRRGAEVLGHADFAERVRAYELHISLEAQRFNAAMGRVHLLDEVFERAEQLALT